MVSELALSLMLLIGAGLLVRSFVRLQSVPPGFTTYHVLTMRVAATGSKYQKEEPVAQFYRQIGERISHLPGVAAEGVVSTLPLTGAVGWGGINVEGFTPRQGQELQVDLKTASADYFRTMEIPLRSGRFFSEHDTPATQQVAILDDRFARRFWPNGDGVGRHIWFDPKKPITIVGTVRQHGLEDEGKIVPYFPDQQNADNGMYLAVRASSDAAALATSVVHEIHQVDSTATVYEVRTMRDRLYSSLARQRFSTTMLWAPSPSSP